MPGHPAGTSGFHIREVHLLSFSQIDMFLIFYLLEMETAIGIIEVKMIES